MMAAHPRLIAVAVLVLLVVVAAAAQADTVTSDTVRIMGEDEVVPNVEVALRLSERTTFDGVDTVVIGRDDVFADSLASGSLQGRGPLLLVPPDGPVPERVLDRLETLDPARVVLLGGTSALSEAVEDQLAERYEVERRGGASRIETAIEVAEQDASDATTAILARAFAAEGASDPTQAFADVLAAGGWAADNGWPILFTPTAAMPDVLRDYLFNSSIEQVHIMGGQAAVSMAVENQARELVDEVDRVAGDNRFATAVRVAEERGAASSADVDHVLLVEGQEDDAWAGGFVAAARSAVLDAPIVLANKDMLPEVTEEWLRADGGFAVDPSDGSEPVLTCVTGPEPCETARVALGLPPAATVEFDPAEVDPLAPGAAVEITVEPVPPEIGGTVTVGGTCLDGESTQEVDDDGRLSATASSDLPTPCTISVTMAFPQGTSQTEVATYNVPPGSIVGQAVDAVTGDPMAGVTVSLDRESAEEVTASDGAFEFVGLRPGAYELTATATGFESVSSEVAVRSEQETTSVLALSPALEEGELRIVLSWGQEPEDLDSHLWLPMATPYHLFWDRPGSLDDCPAATLDRDDINSFGPETVTITSVEDGRYRYAVNNFGTQPAPLARSGARVQVFDSTGQVASFTAPSGDSTAQWWHVFDLVDGTVEAVNQLTPTAPAPYGDTGACATPQDTSPA